MMLMRCFCFPDFLYKSICCGYSFELHRQVDAIQMGTHNICLYKEVADDDDDDDDDDDEFRFDDSSTHEGHLHQNGVLTWFCNETAIMISHICMKI